jgi:hypothetical protein
MISVLHSPIQVGGYSLPQPSSSPSPSPGPGTPSTPSGLLSGLSLSGLSSGVVTGDHAEEVVRGAGKEVHSVSALVGGVAAQEAVKLVTHQYKPLDNTYVYNGVAGCGAVYCL